MGTLSDATCIFVLRFFRSYLLPGSGTKDVKLLTERSNVQYSGQWMFKIGWPNMGALNVEAADSYFQKDSDNSPFFIVEQCEYYGQSKLQ